jgi:hypothetical protein
VLLHLLIKVKAQFLIEFAFHRVPPEERPKAIQQVA